MAFQKRPRYGASEQINTDGTATELFGVDSDWLDAFGRLRVSDPLTLFEASFTYDLQPLLFETVEATGGTVTHDTNSRSATLTVTGTDGSTAAIQSRSYLPYEKGKSQLIKVTFTFGDPAANVRRRAGYFDAANGFYLEQTGTDVAMVRRSSSTGVLVETRIPQAEWNLDPLDGSGPSGLSEGFTLDLSRAQILVIDGQWLGVGRVRVGFNIDGLNVYVHEFLHANREPVAPYTQTFSLPTRWEIASVGASAGATLQAICCEVESEGGVASPNGLTFATANTADIATSVTRAHLLSIRPATEYPAASGQTNRTFIIPGSLSTLVASNDCLIEVFYASTLTGGTWTTPDANSAVEVGIGQTISAVGVPVDRFFVASGSGATRNTLSGNIDSQYPLALSIAGDAPRALTITATTLTGTGSARAALAWKEIR